MFTRSLRTCVSHAVRSLDLQMPRGARCRSRQHPGPRSADSLPDLGKCANLAWAHGGPADVPAAAASDGHSCGSCGSGETWPPIPRGGISWPRGVGKGVRLRDRAEVGCMVDVDSLALFPLRAAERRFWSRARGVRAVRQSAKSSKGIKLKSHWQREVADTARVR